MQVYILIFSSLLFWGHQKNVANYDKVNPIIGNQSYIETFEKNPNIQTNDYERVRTHLKFVYDKLLVRETKRLSRLQLKNRKELLNHLNNYIEAGLFPKNYAIKGKRAPCFIDQDGTICAVGYLVEQSAGREVAETINAKYQYASIYEMDSEILKKWQKTCGLTMQELAMIQPTYGPMHRKSYLGLRHGIPAITLNTTNIALSSLSWTSNSDKRGRRYARINMGVSALNLFWTVRFHMRNYTHYSPTDMQRRMHRTSIATSALTFASNSTRLLRKKPKNNNVSLGLNLESGLGDQWVYGLRLQKVF